MHFFNSQTGQMEEIKDENKKNILINLLEIWVNRPQNNERIDMDKLLYRFWHLLAIVIITIILSITFYNMHENAGEIRLAIERAKNGYCQVSVPGVGGAVWQKCK